MGLYKVHLRHVVSSTVTDIMMYRKPLLSLYTFTVWMLLVYYRLIHLVPSFLVSILIFIFIGNCIEIEREQKNREERDADQLRFADVVSILVYGKRQRKEESESQLRGSTAVEKVDLKSRSLLFADLDSYKQYMSQCQHPNDHHKEFPFSNANFHRQGSMADMLVPTTTGKRINMGIVNYDLANASIYSEDDKDDKIAIDTPVVVDDRPRGPEQNDEVDTKEGHLFRKNL